jgi:hypothetical protein
MVINYLDVRRVSLVPSKTDSILVVDSNAMLSDTRSLQSFQIVTPRSRKISQLARRVQRFQLSPRRTFDMSQRWYILLFEKSFCAGIAKAFDHGEQYSPARAYRQTVSASRSNPDLRDQFLGILSSS